MTTDRRFNAMRTRAELLHPPERHDQTDRPVPAHVKVAGVVEEDDARRTGGIRGFAKQSADQHVGPARLVDDG